MGSRRPSGRLVRNAALIILFVLSGLIFLGGGIAAIIDGLPYLVLERGFTQVIVGTVLATSGILLLALSRVLAELRRVRTTLSNAMMAVSVASMAGEPSASVRGGMNSAAAAGMGLATGAGAAAVAAQLLADDDQGHKAEPSDKSSAGEAEDLDLFGQPKVVAVDSDQQATNIDAETVAGFADPAEVQTPLAQHELAWPGDISDDFDRPTPAIDDTTDEAKGQLSEAAPVADIVEAGDAISGGAATAEDDRADTPVESVARAAPWLGWPQPKFEPEPKFEAEAEPEPEPEPEFEPKFEPEPELDANTTLRSTADDTRPGDEFGFLRESLAGRLAEREDNSGSDDGRRTGTLGDAESWMVSPATRREPWFENAEATAEPETHAEQSDAGLDAAPALHPPLWPPQTRDHATVESGAEAWPEVEAEPEAPSGPAELLPEPEEASPVFAGEPTPASEEPQPAAEPAPPAASNEGIVGAYQVGDAHFTIFADGSIKARTPDGDYRFASMEELKVYLASEKSRLGV